MGCTGNNNISIDSQDNDGENNQSNLTQYQIDVINYFKDIALGFEFGTASAITRKWKTNLKIFVGGKDSSVLKLELTTLLKTGLK